MTFYEAYAKAEKLEPGDGPYIRLCKVLQESGANRREITKYFNEVMTKDDYDKEEKNQLIDYLVEKANEIID